MGADGEADVVGAAATAAPSKAMDAALELASGHVSGRVVLKRSVLFVHHHPPQQRLGSDRRLLALLGQVRPLGFSVSSP